MLCPIYGTWHYAYNISLDGEKNGEYVSMSGVDLCDQIYYAKLQINMQKKDWWHDFNCLTTV